MMPQGVWLWTCPCASGWLMVPGWLMVSGWPMVQR